MKRKGAMTTCCSFCSILIFEVKKNRSEEGGKKSMIVRFIS